MKHAPAHSKSFFLFAMLRLIVLSVTLFYVLFHVLLRKGAVDRPSREEEKTKTLTNKTKNRNVGPFAFIESTRIERVNVSDDGGRRKVANSW